MTALGDRVPLAAAPANPADAREQASLGAAWLLRHHLLDRMDAAFVDAGLQVLLVKGAAMAHRYAKPWHRTMADIDLLVRQRDASAVATALRSAGLQQLPAPADRRHSQHAFFDRSFIDTCGGARQLVEAHTELDKMVARPVDRAGIFARASPRQQGSSLWLPSDEDHVLLQVLHVAAADFIHPAAWQDLALLWHPTLCKRSVLVRARSWRATTALHFTLQAMRRHGIEVEDEYLRATRPPGWRRKWLEQLYSEQKQAAASAETREMGWAWVRRQTLLRDDVLAWCGGVVAYGLARLRDRLD